MAQKVGILDGEVNRNWHLVDGEGGKHLLSLFHDCVTGARAAMLDYEEVPGSAGTTNVFNLVTGRVDIPFTMKKGSEAAKDSSGRLSILRRGLTGFSYECKLDGKLVLDTTSIVQNTAYEYEVSMPATVDTGSRVSGVTWYEVHTTRKKDGKGTLVHRRFRDFCALQEQVESLMKGHHLRSSLPRFPGKKSKLWTNHGDLNFVEDRRRSLEQYVKTLLQLPHVSTLDSTRAFLGMVGNLREFSVSWDGKELGVKLKRASEVAGGKLGSVAGGGGPNGDGGAPPVITSVQGDGKSPPGVQPGDRLFKVNGDSTELMTLEAAWSSVARATRPVMLHFLGPILRMDSTLTPLPDAFLRRRTAPPGAPFGPGGGGAPLAGGRPRPDGNNGDPASAATASDGSQRSLRGIWPAWRRGGEAGGSGDKHPPEPASTPATTAALERRGPAGNRVGSRGPAGGGAVGPFGNGAGAAAAGRRKLPANSPLFGADAAGAGGGGGGGGGGGFAERARGTKRESLFDSWRSAEGAAGVAGAGAGAGGAVRSAPSRAFGARGGSDWMPDMSRGSAASASGSGEPATLLGAAGALAPPPREENRGSSQDDSTRHSATEFVARPAEGLFSGVLGGAGAGAPTDRSAGYGSGSSGSSFAAAAAPAWPPERPNVSATGTGGSATVEVAAEQGKSRRIGGDGNGNGSGNGSSTGPFSDPTFSSFGAGASLAAGRAQQSPASGPFGSNLAAEAEERSVGDAEEDGDDDDDDENPFA
ncbi:unnamed protein product [Pylaiella littoralis]